MAEGLVSPIPHPSLSRDLHSDALMPSLIHTLHDQKSSVLSLATSDKYIFSGSQNQDILVWRKDTFALKAELLGHTGSVLSLECAKEKEWLFSSSGDSTVRIWSTTRLEPLYVLSPFLENCAGDLFSLAWSSVLQTIFVGCQNTSLQWYDFRDAIPHPESSTSIDTSSSGASTPSGSGNLRKVHKFFDSYPQYERRPADLFAKNGSSSRLAGRSSPESERSVDIRSPRAHLAIPATSVLDSAHYGYIYCMAISNGVRDDKHIQLATGSGDESVKLWSCLPEGPKLVHEFTLNHGAILAIIMKGDTIYAGCQDGYVKVLDLETKTLVRTIIVQEGIDILSMSMLNSDLFTCSADGWVKRWSASFDNTASWKAHSGIVLSSIVTGVKNEDKGYSLITGGNDSDIKVWNVEPPRRSVQDDPNHSCIGTGAVDALTYALTKFVSIPSVSCSSSHKEDCRQAAIWLRKCLGQLGARTTLLPTGEGNNPLVLGTFEGTIGERRKPRVLFYGHYDTISAPPNGWNSDPFVLTGRNGYLYGRGVTDDKGPIIAVACAAAELLSRRSLEIDLVFLIEGDEECGSAGFGEAVRKHKDVIGDIDAILVSNSTWIGDDRPCITYGLRGVIHCTFEITSHLPDLHSGIDGGGLVEPMSDMVKLLAMLTDSSGRVQIPNFYDSVRLETKDEKELYKLLSQITQKPPSSLASRWREPSLTIHTIEISGPNNATVIPGTVKAQVSLRIVPDQDLNDIVTSLSDYLKTAFRQFRSPNHLEIRVDNTADWWLGNLDDPWFKALESAVQEEWGEEPLRIREGGSIPSVPYLEKEFNCHALHLPMGQSSDQAHLPNERISLVNLHKGKAVIERFLLKVADKNFKTSSRS